jgi:hypothetical protein
MIVATSPGLRGTDALLKILDRGSRLGCRCDGFERSEAATTDDVSAADPLEESRARDPGVLSDDDDRSPVREFGFDPIAEIVAEERRAGHAPSARRG